MAANSVNGSGNGARSGARTLLLLASPLNVVIVRALADCPRGQSEVRRAAGSPAQTTLRAQLKRLAELGVIERHRRNRFPGVVEWELTEAGHELLLVLDVLERWLRGAPDGGMEPGDNAAKAAIKALAGGWSTGMLRLLAASPLSLTELDGLIATMSYPSLERRLGALRLAGQIEARRGNGHGTPYVVTDWLREGIAPLAVASRWERRHQPHATAPISRLDVEAILLLAMPMLRLPADPSGTCRVAAVLGGERRQRLAGVVVGVEDSRVASCTTELRGDPDAWALGSQAALLAALVDGDPSGFEMGGDGRLARSILNALHGRLFLERTSAD